LETEGATHNHDTKFKNTVEKLVQKTATIAGDEKSPAIKTFGKSANPLIAVLSWLVDVEPGLIGIRPTHRSS
jgi:hypothetical protein